MTGDQHPPCPSVYRADTGPQRCTRTDPHTIHRAAWRAWGDDDARAHHAPAPTGDRRHRMVVVVEIGEDGTQTHRAWHTGADTTEAIVALLGREPDGAGLLPPGAAAQMMSRRLPDDVVVVGQ